MVKHFNKTATKNNHFVLRYDFSNIPIINEEILTGLSSKINIELATNNLIQGIKTNNLDVVKKALEEGALLNIEIDGEHLLFFTIKHAGKEILDLLLKNGLDTESTKIFNQEFKINVLMYASTHASSEVIKFIIENFHIDVNEKDIFGMNALMYAILSKNREAAKTLIQYGIDVNAQNKYNSTAIFFSTAQNDYEMCKLLIENGADLGIRNSFGISPREIAIWHNYEELFDLYGIDRNRINGFHNTKELKLIDSFYEELREGLIKNDIERFIKALSNGANLYTKQIENYNINVFYSAALHGSLKVLSYLDMLNYDFNEKDSIGRNVILFLFDERIKDSFVDPVSEMTLEFLISRVDLNIQDNEGNTILMKIKFKPYFSMISNQYEIGVGAENTFEKIIQKISNFKEFINLRNNKGETALMIAAKRSDEFLWKKLIEKGASLDIPDNNGLYPLMVTRWNLTKFVYENYPERINLQLKDSDGRNLLMYAIKNDDYHFAEWLISKGIDVNAKDNFGTTALMYATLFKRVGIAKLLLDNNADVNAVDNGGRSAIFYYCYNKIGNLNIVKLLIERGADVNIVDNYYNTVLTVAAGNNDLDDLAYLLMRNGACICRKTENGYKLVSIRDLTMLQQLNKFLLDAFNSMDYAKMEFLLENGAYADYNIDVKVYDPINNLEFKIDTLLEWAIFRNDIQAIRILLKHGANHLLFDEHKEAVNKFLDLYATEEVKNLLDNYQYRHGCYRF